MAVLGRLLISSAERLDLPDFLSVDSFTQGDFKFLMKSFVGSDKPYVLAGFDVINPGSSIGTQNISIRVADSIVYFPESLAGPFFHGLEEGNTLSTPLVPELRKNSTNYVYLTLTTQDAAQDIRAFWDPDKEGGDGGEFTQDINTQTALVAAINVSTSSFPEDTVPVAIVEVGANFVTSIEDARDMMFRLGSGGISPDPLATYNFRELPTAANARLETNTLMDNALDANPFQGGDKNILTLKEWMDVVMTKLLELSGTTYWYEDASTFNLVNMFKDALGTSIKSKGIWQSSDSTPGLLTWTEDILSQTVSDNKDYIIRNGNKTLSNDQTMYISLTRRQPINTGSVQVTWLNGINYVDGTLGSFENLTKGDWVKKSDDSDFRYLRVEEFFAATALGGGVTSANNALSIKLSATYSGTSEDREGVYDKGVYLSSDVLVADRDASALTDAGGDLYWLAMRSDTVMNISDITTTTLSIVISEHDGSTAKVVSAAHGLTDKQRIAIAGSANFDGEYIVEVEDSNTFYINISSGPFADEAAQSAFYATITTQARTTDDGLQLESANHEFDVNQNILMAGTTNYNGSFKVFSTGNTTFTIPVTSAIANETAGTATAVVMLVRTDLGPTRLDQGENKQIGEVDSENLMLFMGMDNASQTFPTWHTPPDYDTIDGYVNYNGIISDNMTQRVSKLTAMMADKAQDKTIQLDEEDINTIVNTTNGGAQDITFTSSGTPLLNFVLPTSTNNGSLTLTGTLSLNINQAAYIQVDRNNSFSFANLGTVTVADIDSIPLDENIYIIAVRLSGTTVWLWNGLEAPVGVTPSLLFLQQIVKQNASLKMIAGGTWTWDGSNLTFTSDAYVQIPSLTKERNTIPTSESPIALAADEVAYVEVNRTAGGTTNLTVNVADEAAVVLTPTTIVIARRDGSDVIVGTGTTRLRTNESSVLEATMSSFDVQDSNSKLIAGGTASWDGGATQLTFSADAYIQIPGLTKERNTIPTSESPITLTADQVAYVTINRTTGGAANLTVNVADEASVPTAPDTVVIAREDGGEVLVGNQSMRLIDGENKKIDTGVSDQILNIIPATSNADDSGQARLILNSSNAKRVDVTSFEKTVPDGTEYNTQIKNLLLNFSGAQIDFDTGSIFEDDGTTPLGIDFTPATIAAGEFRWYSVTLVANTVAADNRISAQLIVVAADADGATADAAPRAAFANGTKIGQVVVQESGGSITDIVQSDIIQLSTTGGGEGAGDASSIIETLKNRLLESSFELLTPNVFSQDEDVLIDAASTGTFARATNNFEYDAIGKTLVSVQMLDPDEFLANDSSLNSIELMTFWNLDNIDLSATYEVSRNGGNEYQTVTMDRIGSTEVFRGCHVFDAEASNQVLSSEVTNNTSFEIDTTTQQKLSQKVTIANKSELREIDLELTINNTPLGNMFVSIVNDDSGTPGQPSLDLNDILAETNAIDITGLSSGTLTVTLPTTVTVSGDYHIVIRTDQDYKDSFSTGGGGDNIAFGADSAGPASVSTYNGTVWAQGTASLTHSLEGIEFDLRVRITSGTEDVNLDGYGIFYDLSSGGLVNDIKERQVFHFQAVADNDNEFTLTQFTPDSDILNVYYVQAGQVFRFGAFTVQGNTIVFPVDQFNNGGVETVVTLVFDQTNGGSFDSSDLNALLLSNNHLGSTDGGIDKSLPGRGIFLRRPDGTLREVTINDNDEIEIFSV